MEKRIFSKIIDNLFLIVCVFIVSFLWVRFYQHNPVLILLYSSLITSLIYSAIHLIIKHKQIKNKSIKKEDLAIANLSHLLLFSTNQECIKIFENSLKLRNLEYTKTTKYILFNNNMLIPFYSKTKVDDNDILQIFLKAKQLKIKAKLIIICAKNFTEDAKNFIKTMSQQEFLLLDERQTFNTFFKPINYQIETKSQQKNKQKFKDKVNNLVNIAFNKSRFKGYLTSAIILLIASYFMRYNIYYLVFSSLLMILALFSYFNKPFNKPKKDIFTTDAK